MESNKSLHCRGITNRSVCLQKAAHGCQLNIPLGSKFTQSIAGYDQLSGVSSYSGPGILYPELKGIVRQGLPAVSGTLNRKFFNYCKPVFHVENIFFQHLPFVYQKRTVFTSRSYFDPLHHKATKNVKLWQGEEEKSKVEEAVKAIKKKKEKLKEKAFQMECSPEEVEPMVAVAPAPKKTLWERAKHEVVHYYNGFKLLFLETRIAARLLWQVMNGKMLTRRERRQVSCYTHTNMKFIEQFSLI